MTQQGAGEQTRDDIRPVKRAWEDVLLARPGVVGVDIAEKVSDGAPTGRLAIVVHVEVKRSLEKAGTIARGLGRSYGDQALNEHRRVVTMTRLDRYLAFDEATGVLRCEAGVPLAQLITDFAPRGFFPAITPGTKFVTVGGCIANDVHGKAHHAQGTFVTCVESLQLLDPTAGFFQSGMDSLMSVTLQRALSDSLGETLPASVVFDYPTVEALSAYLATLLPELVEAAEDDDVDAYDDFSDDELLKQLSDRLG